MSWWLVTLGENGTKTHLVQVQNGASHMTTAGSLQLVQAQQHCIPYAAVMMSNTLPMLENCQMSYRAICLIRLAQSLISHLIR